MSKDIDTILDKSYNYLDNIVDTAGDLRDIILKNKYSSRVNENLVHSLKMLDINLGNLLDFVEKYSE